MTTPARSWRRGEPGRGGKATDSHEAPALRRCRSKVATLRIVRLSPLLSRRRPWPLQVILKLLREFLLDVTAAQ